MVKYGKEILENMMERMLTRIQKETWEPFSFQKHGLIYKFYEKKIAFRFETEDCAFHFGVYAGNVRKEWLEHMRIEIEIYEGAKGAWWHVGYGKIIKEGVVLEKIYNIVKEEVERTFHDIPELRMKYLFNKEEMLRPDSSLNIVLEQIRG